MMKRILALLTIFAVVLAFAGCAKTDDNNKDAEETAAEAETRPFGRTEEPEWAPVDCEIMLSSNGVVYAEKAELPTFALIGTNSDNCSLLFKVDKMAAATLSMNAGDADDFILTVNGEVQSGTISFNEDYTEMTFKGDSDFSALCELASVIRGL